MHRKYKDRIDLYLRSYIKHARLGAHIGRKEVMGLGTGVTEKF